MDSFRVSFTLSAVKAGVPAVVFILRVSGESRSPHYTQIVVIPFTANVLRERNDT
jgi:hypothetical protein